MTRVWELCRSQREVVLENFRGQGYFFFGFLTHENGNDSLSRNVDKKLLLYYIKNQRDATLAVLFISNCKITLHVSDASSRPSSGVLKTVVTATGACHGSG